MSWRRPSGNSLPQETSSTRMTTVPPPDGVNISQRVSSRLTTRDTSLQSQQSEQSQQISSKLSQQSEQRSSKLSQQSEQRSSKLSQQSDQSRQTLLSRQSLQIRKTLQDQESPPSQPSEQSDTIEIDLSECRGPPECPPTRPGSLVESRLQAPNGRKSMFNAPDSCAECRTDGDSSEFNWMDNVGERFRRSMDTKTICKDTCSVRRQMRRSSVMLPALAEAERTFFELVAVGDAGAVRNFLSSEPDFNVNCTDYQGLSALAIAVGAGDIPMTELLLEQPDIDVGDCALRAAQAGDTRLLQMLLDQLRKQGEGREFAGCAGSPDYPDGTTALLLAAQQGHYDAIALLLSRGHSLRRPHGPGCRCKETCGPQKMTQDPVALGAARLALYRAWVSPAFLCHSCEDPILEAFLLCKELCQWAAATPPLRPAFTQLAKRARRFSADLMGCCRTASEVETLLRERAGYDFPRAFIFPRLMLAVDLKQKEFVAHPNTQQVLETAWSDEWTEWQSRPGCLKALTVVPRMLLLPVTAAVTIFAPGSSLGHSFALPVSKYLSHCASYLIFLALIFMQSNLDRKHQLRGCPKSGLEPVIVLFMCGHIWGSSRLCLIMGPRRYFSVLRNWYDAVTQLLFVATFLFWLAAAFDVKANDQQELERKFWHALDPTLLSEGFFALATILAFGRLLLLLQFSFHLGPLQVSLGKMFKDIAKFLTIFIIVLFAFAAGLCRFYQYYEGMSQRDSWGGTTAQLSSFVSLPHTLKTLFWCIFCMSPLEAADVVIENIPGADGTTIVNTHYFTEAVGHLCFALFMVFSVIVLLNMLIATICNTFQKVTENVDVEWTFGRTEVYLVYLLQTTLPPPLNLLPTAGGLAAVGRWFSLLRSHEEGGPRARWSPGHCCFVEAGPPTEEEQRDYAAVLAQLAQRYFREQENAIEFGPTIPTASDTESLRREIKGLREALIYAVGSERSPSPGSSIPRGRSPLPKAYIPLPSSSHVGEIGSSSVGDEEHSGPEAEEGWEFSTVSATGSLNSSRNVTFDSSVTSGLSIKRNNYGTPGGRSHISALHIGERSTHTSHGGRSPMSTIAEGARTPQVTHGGRSKIPSLGSERFSLSALVEEGNVNYSGDEQNGHSTQNGALPNRALPGDERVKSSTSKDMTCIPSTRVTERNMFCLPGVGRNILLESNERIMFPSRASVSVRCHDRYMLPVLEEQNIVPQKNEPNVLPPHRKVGTTPSMSERKMRPEYSPGRKVLPSCAGKKKIRGRSERIVLPARGIEENPLSGGRNNLSGQGERSVYQTSATLLPVLSDEQDILLGQMDRSAVPKRCTGRKTPCSRGNEKFVPSAPRDERDTLLSRVEGVKATSKRGTKLNEDVSRDGERIPRLSRDNQSATRSLRPVERKKYPSRDREPNDIEENPRTSLRGPRLSHSAAPTRDEQLKSITLRDTIRKARSLARGEERTSKYPTQEGRRKARSSEHAGERASFTAPCSKICPEKRKGRTLSKSRGNEKESLSVNRYKERPRSTMRTGEQTSPPTGGERRTRSVVAHAVRASGQASLSEERGADEGGGGSYPHQSFEGMLHPERYPAAQESTTSTTSAHSPSPVISSELAIVERSSMSDAIPPPTRGTMHSLREKSLPNEPLILLARDSTYAAKNEDDTKSPRTRSQSRGKRKCSPSKKLPCAPSVAFPRRITSPSSPRAKSPLEARSKSPPKAGTESPHQSMYKSPRQLRSQFLGKPETERMRQPEPKLSSEQWTASSRQPYPRPRRKRRCKELREAQPESHQPEPKSPRERGAEFSNEPGPSSPRRRGSKSPRQTLSKSPRQSGSKSPRQSGSKSPRQTLSKSPRQSGSKSSRQSMSKSPRQPQPRYPCIPTCSRWLSRTGRSNQRQRYIPLVSQSPPQSSSVQRSPRQSSLIHQDSRIEGSTPSPVQASRRQSSTERETPNRSLNQTGSPRHSRPSSPVPASYQPLPTERETPSWSLNQTDSPGHIRSPSPVQASRRQSSTERETPNWSLNQTDSPGQSRPPSPVQMSHRPSSTDPQHSYLNISSSQRSRGPSPDPSRQPSNLIQPDSQQPSRNPSGDQTSQRSTRSAVQRSRHSSLKQSDSRHQSTSPTPVQSPSRKLSSSQGKRQSSRRQWRRLSGRRSSTPTQVDEVARRTVARSLAEGSAVAYAAREAKKASMPVAEPSDTQAEGDSQ